MRASAKWAALLVSAVVPAGIWACRSSGPVDPPGLEFPTFGAVRTLADHREVDTRFKGADGSVLAGTIYLPPASPAASVALHPGSAWTTRSSWEELSPFVLALDLAMLSYDKRGQAESGGSCCPSSADDLFDLLALDLAAAAGTLDEYSETANAPIGVIGSSLGGWVTPLAANATPDDIDFLINTVGGAVSTGQEGLYDELTGFADCMRTQTSMTDIIQRLQDAGPSGFDPRSSLLELVQPTLWLFGGNDLSHPTELAVINLLEIESIAPKPWTIVVVPGANHNFVDGGGICQEEGPMADGLTPLADWLLGVVLP